MCLRVLENSDLLEKWFGEVGGVFFKQGGEAVMGRKDFEENVG